MDTRRDAAHREALEAVCHEADVTSHVIPAPKACIKTPLARESQSLQAYREMDQLLQLPVLPTAVFVGSDDQCLGVYRALYDHGLPIPDAMSVVGFDDMPYAARLTPALTTVRQPLREMGRVATRMLLRVMAGEVVDVVRVELATPLIVRASCAPPSNA
jgi:LacI family transcriptional regulator